MRNPSERMMLMMSLALSTASGLMRANVPSKMLSESSSRLSPLLDEVIPKKLDQQNCEIQVQLFYLVVDWRKTCSIMKSVFCLTHWKSISALLSWNNNQWHWLTQALSAFFLSLSDIIQAWILNILHVYRFTKSILFKHFDALQQ